MGQPRDLRTVRRAKTPNDALAAPPGAAGARVDLAVPVWPVPAARLEAALRAVAEAEPRTALVAEHPELGQLVFVQRSRLLGFKDRIVAQRVEVPGGVSLLLHSRSLTGGWDLGANRRRLKRWLARLDADLSSEA